MLEMLHYYCLTVVENCNTEMQNEMRDGTVEHSPGSKTDPQHGGPHNSGNDNDGGGATEVEGGKVCGIADGAAE